LLIHGYGVVMNSAHKKFLKIIYEDIKYNIECLLFLLIWTIIAILTILISLDKLPFEVMFWYLGMIVCIGLINVLYLIITDIIIYLKNCWNNSKDY
jgi:hypothetical protein